MVLGFYRIQEVVVAAVVVVVVILVVLSLCIILYFFYMNPCMLGCFDGMTVDHY